MALTLRCFPDGLRIYATPIEWLYEYPTYTEDDTSKGEPYYKDHMKGNKTEDIIRFLTNIVGSYDEITLQDLVRNATSN